MTNAPSLPRGGRPRPTPRLVTVTDVQVLSPRMRRVVFEGDDLATFAWSGPAAHLKLAFPEPGHDAPPTVTPDGPRPTTRTYTPRRFDADQHQLEIDFVLHGAGIGSAWATQARAGQQVVVLGPARGYSVAPEAAWYVLAGDESALPAIETLLEAIPAHIPVRVFIEVAAADEQRSLPTPERTEARWLARDGALPGTLLKQAVEAQAWPAGDGRFYVGCEAGTMREIRRSVLERSGLDRASMVTRGYWRAGAANHPDHDYGED